MTRWETGGPGFLRAILDLILYCLPVVHTFHFLYSSSDCIYPVRELAQRDTRTQHAKQQWLLLGTDWAATSCGSFSVLFSWLSDRYFYVFSKDVVNTNTNVVVANTLSILLF